MGLRLDGCFLFFLHMIKTFSSKLQKLDSIRIKLTLKGNKLNYSVSVFYQVYGKGFLLV